MKMNLPTLWLPSFFSHQKHVFFFFPTLNPLTQEKKRAIELEFLPTVGKKMLVLLQRASFNTLRPILPLTHP